MSSSVNTAFQLERLEQGPLHRFCEWPNPGVPRVCAGNYTIWLEEQLIYAGMSGRSLSEQALAAHRSENTKNKGLYTRLNSHASGKRSGDQFCVYVADRLVLPRLSGEQIQKIGQGELSLDQLTKDFIHQHLSYRYVETRDGQAAFLLEAEIRKGQWQAGKPLLNPL